MKPFFYGLLLSTTIFSQSSTQLADSLYALRAIGSKKNVAKPFYIEGAIKNYTKSYNEKNSIESVSIKFKSSLSRFFNRS